MSLALYRGLSAVGAPLVEAWLRRRLARGKEQATRFGERLGHPSLPRPPGPLLWIHAASVGEALSVLPLTARILAERPGLAVLFTSGTVTSAAILAERLPAGARHQYVPVDLPAAVARFLDHWRPDAALWVESEFWPNLLQATRARRVPTALVNARLSPTSYRRWRRARGLIRPLLTGFAPALAQSAAEAERLCALGADARWVGNLKWDAPALPVDGAALAALSAAIGERPRWVAASLHPEEDAGVMAAAAALRRAVPDALAILVPRHPERGPELAARLRADGCTVARRGAGEVPDATTDVYLADTIGELGLFYRLTEIAFVGGTLIPHGGQNLLEPARLGCAVLHGPSVFNFADVAALLDESGGALAVADAAALGTALAHLVTDAAARRTRARAAARVAQELTGSLEAVLDALAPLLERVVPRAAERARA